VVPSHRNEAARILGPRRPTHANPTEKNELPAGGLDPMMVMMMMMMMMMDNGLAAAAACFTTRP
jgi:hypothetical protein